MRITIVGAGAIGGTIDAQLARAGHDISFVDAADEHVRAINAHGLTIEGSAGSFTVRAPAVTPADLCGSLGTVFLAGRPCTRTSRRVRSPRISRRTAWSSRCRNGFNEERIAAFVGVGRTISAFVNFGADYQEPAVSSTAVRARCSSENSTAH